MCKGFCLTVCVFSIPHTRLFLFFCPRSASMSTTAAAVTNSDYITALSGAVRGFMLDFGIDPAKATQSSLVKGWMLTALCDASVYKNVGPRVVGEYITAQVLLPRNQRMLISYNLHLPSEDTSSSFPYPSSSGTASLTPTRATTWSDSTWQAAAEFLQPHTDHNARLYRSGERAMAKRFECTSFVAFDNLVMDRFGAAHYTSRVANEPLLLWAAGVYASPDRLLDVKRALLGKHGEEYAAKVDTLFVEAKRNAQQQDLLNVLQRAELTTGTKLNLTLPSGGTSNTDPRYSPSAIEQRIREANEKLLELYHPLKAVDQTEKLAEPAWGGAEPADSYVDSVDAMLHHFAASVGLNSMYPMKQIEFAYVLAGMPNAGELFQHFYAHELDSVKQRFNGFIQSQQQPLHDNDHFAHLLSRTLVPDRLNSRTANRELAICNTELQPQLDAFVRAYNGGGDSKLPLERRIGMWIMYTSHGLYPQRFALHYGGQSAAQESALAEYNRNYPVPSIRVMDTLRTLYFIDKKGE